MIVSLEFEDVLEIQDDDFSGMLVQEGVDVRQDGDDLVAEEAVDDSKRLHRLLLVLNFHILRTFGQPVGGHSMSCQTTSDNVCQKIWTFLLLIPKRHAHIHDQLKAVLGFFSYQLTPQPGFELTSVELHSIAYAALQSCLPRSMASFSG